MAMRDKQPTAEDSDLFAGKSEVFHVIQSRSGLVANARYVTFPAADIFLVPRQPEITFSAVIGKIILVQQGLI